MNSSYVLGGADYITLSTTNDGYQCAYAARPQIDEEEIKARR